VTRRRVVTADDVLSVARTGGRELVVAPGDRVTPLARDVAQQHQVRVVEDAGGPPHPASPQSPTRPRLTHVPGASTVPLDPFPFPGPAPAMDVRTRDVVTGENGVPMAAGVMSLREGAFPWTLDYDEVEYVLEGELHLTCGDQVVVARPGDVVAVPRGSSITFGTPSWARFLYVTYPADWGG
jgi:ethanolamine utilization protein EutQ